MAVAAQRLPWRSRSRSDCPSGVEQHAALVDVLGPYVAAGRSHSGAGDPRARHTYAGCRVPGARPVERSPAAEQGEGVTATLAGWSWSQTATSTGAASRRPCRRRSVPPRCHCRGRSPPPCPQARLGRPRRRPSRGRPASSVAPAGSWRRHPRNRTSVAAGVGADAGRCVGKVVEHLVRLVDEGRKSPTLA